MNPQGPSSDMFQTDANQAANSFSNPMSMSHLYPGWGVNPNYQTPAYDAPYRPAYQGPNPYGAYGRQGFMSAVNQVANPLASSPYWGNPVDNNRNAFGVIAGRPIDLIAHVGQNFAMPLASAMLANKMLTGVGQSIGRGVGGGLMNGLGIGSVAGRGAAALGGFAGGFILPLAAGMAASDAIDGAVFQPYIRTRQMSQTLSDNFSGVTFGGAGGNPISGRGLSGRESSSMSSQIDNMGMRDRTFSANQYHGIASMGMRSGLFDDVGAEDITKRVSSIASQIKMILAISKDPSIQNAIEELGKLRLGGASLNGGALSQAAGAYASIGMSASAAGASVQRVMNTVGTQGQYMFQMNGLTPYLGQMSAATAFSGFASAQRAGILSTAQFARMGGLEGATQSAVAAQMSGINTPFSRMMQANQYLGGNPGGGVVGTVSNFGALASRDPFALQGAMGLYSGQMASQMAQSEGHTGLERQAISSLQVLQRKPGPNGKYSPEEIYGAMRGNGIPAEQAQAYMSMRASQTNSNVLAQQLKAFNAQEIEQMQATVEQNNLHGGFFNTEIYRPATNFLRKVGVLAAAPAHALQEGVSETSDSLHSAFNLFNMSGTIKTENYNSSLNMDNIYKAVKGKDLTDKYQVLEKIHIAATRGGPGAGIARKLLESGFSGPDAKKLFSQFVGAQPGSNFNKMYEDLDSSSKLFDDAASLAKGNIINKGGNSADDIAALGGIVSTKNSMFDNLRILGQAEQVFGTDARLGLDLEDILKEAKYAELNAALGNGSSKDKIDKITAMTKASLAGGYGKSALIAAGMNMSADQVSKDPARFTDDPATRKAIRDANGDLSKVTQIMQGEVSRRSGGIKGNAYKTTGSRTENLGIIANLKASAIESSKAVAASSSGVDYSAFVSASNKIDRGGSLILDAANIFRDAAIQKFSPGLGIGDKK